MDIQRHKREVLRALYRLDRPTKGAELVEQMAESAENIYSALVYLQNSGFVTRHQSKLGPNGEWPQATFELTAAGRRAAALLPDEPEAKKKPRWRLGR